MNNGRTRTTEVRAGVPGPHHRSLPRSQSSTYTIVQCSARGKGRAKRIASILYKCIHSVECATIDPANTPHSTRLLFIVVALMISSSLVAPVLGFVLTSPQSAVRSFPSPPRSMTRGHKFFAHRQTAERPQAHHLCRRAPLPFRNHNCSPPRVLSILGSFDSYPTRPRMLCAAEISYPQWCSWWFERRGRALSLDEAPSNRTDHS